MTRPPALPAPIVTDLPKLFLLDRTADHSGHSHLGVVAIGASFPDGTTVARWRVEAGRLELFASPDELLVVHGHGGTTVLRWLPRALPRRPD